MAQHFFSLSCNHIEMIIINFVFVDRLLCLGYTSFYQHEVLTHFFYDYALATFSYIDKCVWFTWHRSQIKADDDENKINSDEKKEWILRFSLFSNTYR